MFDQLARVQKDSLLAATMIAAVALCALVVPKLGSIVPWTQMSLSVALSTLAAAAGFALSLRGLSKSYAIISRLLAICIAAPALMEWAGKVRGTQNPGGFAHAMSPLAATAFALLALVLVLLRERTGVKHYVADGAAFCLAFTILICVTEYALAATHLFGDKTPRQEPFSVLCVLVLLGFVAFGRRAEYGLCAIFIGSGIGSRIARTLAPFIVVLPFLREMIRAYLVKAHVLPEHVMVAVFGSAAVMVALGLLIFVSLRIESMEEEIRDLSLKDDLTGLLNVRGFRLLAEQALHLAQRSQLTFAVLFIDLDDLKQINDRFGHGAGSALLARTGELLRTTFRDTDVIGRIGGDEFAVAGQFSRAAISSAIARLEHEAAVINATPAPGIRLGLSIGYVVTQESGRESLKDLLDQADAAMYERKKKKKLQNCEL